MDGIHEGETDGARLARMGTDAAAWARELSEALRTVHLAPGPFEIKPDPAPGGLLHGWLCAAIEAGRSAGYSQGRRDATDRLHAVVGPWPIARASEALRAIAWPLPEDSAGRTQPEDPAARDLPADLAGRDIDTYADAKARFEEAWRKHAAEGPHVTLEQRDAAAEPSPIARAADALEQIAETLRSVVRPLNGGVSYPAVRVVRS